MSKIPVPHLRKKLKRLYEVKRNPAIAQHKQLAEQLGVSPPGISQWVSAGCVPDERLDEVLKLFALPKEAFLAEDLLQFINAVEPPKLPPSSAWERLCARAANVAAQPQPQPQGRLELLLRGVSFYVGDGIQGQCLRVGDQFRLHIEGPAGWHVAVFLQDPQGVACLCPHEELGEGNQLALPADSPSRNALLLPRAEYRPFQAERPSGQHWWVVAFLAAPLPDLLKACLRDASATNLPKALADLNWELDKADGSFALRLPFWVLED